MTKVVSLGRYYSFAEFRIGAFVRSLRQDETSTLDPLPLTGVDDCLDLDLDRIVADEG
jgi:hypothetical protein